MPAPETSQTLSQTASITETIYFGLNNITNYINGETQATTSHQEVYEQINLAESMGINVQYFREQLAELEPRLKQVRGINDLRRYFEAQLILVRNTFATIKTTFDNAELAEAEDIESYNNMNK